MSTSSAVRSRLGSAQQDGRRGRGSDSRDVQGSFGSPINRTDTRMQLRHVDRDKEVRSAYLREEFIHQVLGDTCAASGDTAYDVRDKCR